MQSAENGGSCQVDVLDWLGKTTLDIIGLAGISMNQDGRYNHCSDGIAGDT